MCSWLSDHPQICFSKPKEPFYFSTPGWRPGDEERWKVEYPRFFQHWTPEHRAVGEGSVAYLFDEPAIDRILAIRPDARFVVMVRNPLDLVPSLHQRLLFVLEEDEPRFERAWRLQEERSLGRRVPAGSIDPQMLLYGEVGKLGAQVERLNDRVGRDRCHVVVFDDFREDAGREYRRVLEFLGVDDDGRTDFAPHQSGQRYRYRFVQRLLTRPPGANLSLKEERLAKADRKTKRRAMKTAAKKKPWTTRAQKRIRDWNKLPAKREPIPEALREEMRVHFAPDIERLGKVLSRDLSHWCAAR